MTWITILTKLKTLWSKGKYYISFALVGSVAIFVFFVLRRKDKAWEMVQKIKDNHDKEVDIINKSLKEDAEKKQKEVEKYDKIVDKIEKRYIRKKKELDSNYKEDVAKLIKKHRADPQALSKELSKEFGIRYREKTK